MLNLKPLPHEWAAPMGKEVLPDHGVDKSLLSDIVFEMYHTFIKVMLVGPASLCGYDSTSITSV